MITLHIIDEIAAKFEGLTDEMINSIQKQTGHMEKGAFTTAAFKLKVWDGKRSLFRKDGFFFLNMLDKVSGILEEEYGILEEDVVVEDHRLELKHNLLLRDTMVSPSHFSHLGWHQLHPHQVEGINQILKREKGIIEVGTSGGKSGIMGAVVSLYDSAYGSITITKDGKLCSQLKDTYGELGVQAVVLDAKVPVKKRKALIENNRHIITTKKLAMNLTEELTGFCGVFLCDEVHEFGEQFEAFILQALGDCPIRVGLTGTLPEKSKDPLKRARILAHIGVDSYDELDTLIDVPVGDLLKGGFVSDFKVEMIEVDDIIGQQKTVEIGVDNWEWYQEKTHMDTCTERMERIIDVIDHVWDGKNALILCKPEMGKYISSALELDFIDQGTPGKVRESFYQRFEHEDNYLLPATIETTGTGLSINRIFNVFLIDVGANPRYIGQGIGRGLRKDGVYDKINVYDIYTNTVFSKKQEKQRIRYYKKKGYPYFKSKLKFKVEQ